MKSCLKHSPEQPSSPVAVKPPARPSCCKSVSFRCDDVNEVHVADEWDRTPVEMTCKLSYQDILELKEMQISMARANARANAFNFPHLLSAVPVGLLPLLPESPSSVSSKFSSSSPLLPSRGPSSYFPRMGNPDLVHPPSPPSTPPRRMPPPVPAPPPRQAKTFAFLPLLDAPSAPSPPPAPATAPKPKPSSPTLAPRAPTPPSPPPDARMPSASSSYFPVQSPREGHFVPGPGSGSRPPASYSLHHPVPNVGARRKKGMLQPLQSPGLLPPSPFSLYPPSPPLECDWRTLPSTANALSMSQSQSWRSRPGEGDEDWGC